MTYVEVVPVSTAPELLDLLRATHVRWAPQPRKWIFRGLSDTKYDLKPKAFRVDDWKKFSNPGSAAFVPKAGDHFPQTMKELETLTRFMQALDRAGLQVPEHGAIRECLSQVGELRLYGKIDWEPYLEILVSDSMLVLMALAQHHGVPTRLLDWSYVSTTAAYFAAARAAEKPATGTLSVWALSVDFLEHHWLHCARLPLTLPRINLFHAPRATNMNLHAQQGAFTYWLVNEVPLEKIVEQIQERAENEEAHQRKHAPTFKCVWRGPILVHFRLPQVEAPALLRLLSDENVDGGRMFPGADGVVKAMKERSLWPRRGDFDDAWS